MTGEAEIKITIKEGKVTLTSNIAYDDVIQFWLIKSLDKLGDKIYSKYNIENIDFEVKKNTDVN